MGDSLNASDIIYTKEHISNTNGATKEMLDFIQTMIASITELQLKHRDTNVIMKLCSDLVKNLNGLNLSLTEDNTGMTASQVLEVTTDLIRGKIDRSNTQYKRHQNTLSSKFYVAPKDTAIGTRWELKKTTKNGKTLKIPRLIQTPFQYVSILETITTLFQCNEFRDLYFHHNNGRHICKPGNFKYFCCGDVFKKSEFFQRHPQSLQLQIASDDFEICNPLSSKANRHKICAIYFSIQNLPQRFKSKVNNIYLISLCNSDDVKMKHTDFNNLWQSIVNEVKYLEKIGIDIDENINLKGTITQLAFDNLGANTALGFVGSFNASYYCRHCESSLKECQKMSRENILKRRTKESYNEQIDIVHRSEKVKYDETKGVKYYCKLSNLEYFHIIDNPTADIMHDICEGTIPFMLKRLFKACSNAKVFTLDQLNSMVQFFDYGFLDKKNIPSEINLDKRSLGQNATQSLCLFRNIPFILNRYRENPKIKEIWHCVESLLRIVEIVYSYEITEKDLDVLDEMIFLHLEGLINLGYLLIPKHHFMLHYAQIIRSLGPLIHMNMSRYESKHKVFKDFAENTHNFKNINRSLAVKHQTLLCTKGCTYINDIQKGMKVSLDDYFMSQNERILHDTFGDLCNVNQTKWLRINNYEYRKDLVIVLESFFYQIKTILIDENRNCYYLFCKKFTVVSIDSFSNSFRVQEDSTFVLVDLHKLTNTKTYEMKFIESAQYVVAETLELRNQLYLPE